MANKKVSQLTSKPSVLVTDLFPIADPSTGQLYKTTISDLGTAIGSGVSSVNGLVGAVVLDTDDIQELVSPTNKWFTDTRARAALSASSPLAYNSGTGVFSIPAATSSQNGYLTSTDWTTFNSKQAALSGTGFVKISGTTISYDNSTYLTTSAAASTYLALSGGTMNGQIVLKEASSSTDYTKGLIFPNDPFGGVGDVSGLRLYANTVSGIEAQVLELYVGNDISGSASKDSINFATGVNQTPDNNLVTINGNIIWNAGNLTPQSQLNGTGFVKASGTTISYDNTSYLSLTGGTLTGDLTINKSSPNFSLNVPSGTSGQYNLNNGAGSLMWAMYTTTGGSNAQGNWQLYSAGKTGGAGNIIDITPAGATSFSSSISVPNANASLYRILLNTNSGYSVSGTIGYSSNDGNYIWAKGGTASNFTILNDGGSSMLTMLSNGTTTFLGSVGIGISPNHLLTISASASNKTELGLYNTFNDANNRNWAIATNQTAFGDFHIKQSNAKDGNPTSSGTSRLIIFSAGRVAINRGDNGGGMFTVKSDGSSSAANALFIQNSGDFELFSVRNDGLINTGTRATSPYNNTTGSGANLFVDVSGILYRSTSSIKYKKNVLDYSKGLSEIMQMRAVTYEGKSKSDEGKIFAGLIAEEIHDLGLTEFVQYAKDGTPDALAYSNMVSLLVKGIQELKAELNTLKNK